MPKYAKHLSASVWVEDKATGECIGDWILEFGLVNGRYVFYDSDMRLDGDREYDENTMRLHTEEPMLIDWEGNEQPYRQLVESGMMDEIS